MIKDGMLNREEAKEILDSIKLSPTKKRILSIPTDLLLKHYALIVYKASSLSSKERSLIKERVAYKLAKKEITAEEVADSINDLTEFLENKIKEELDDSITK